jgi:hypothetical protein
MNVGFQGQSGSNADITETVAFDPTETLATPNHNTLDAVSALPWYSFYQLRCRL